MAKSRRARLAARKRRHNRVKVRSKALRRGTTTSPIAIDMPMSADVSDQAAMEEARETLGHLFSVKDAPVKQRERSGGSAVSAGATRSGGTEQSVASFRTTATSSTAVSQLYSTTSSLLASTQPSSVDENSKEHSDHGLPPSKANVPATSYSHRRCDPTGPRQCDRMDFRDFDPFCPKHYRCRGYDMDAEWFDGKSKTEGRYVIDLEQGSMDRLPDVRPYLYYVGYWGFWELEGATLPDSYASMGQAEIEDFYVCLARTYLMHERKLRRGYFMANEDWADQASKGLLNEMPFFGLFGTPTTDENVGLEDYHDDFYQLDVVLPAILKTNLRTAMPTKDLVKVRPGHPDWDLYIQWLYDRENHGIDQIINQHWSRRNIDQYRLSELRHGRFLEDIAWFRYR